MKQIHQRSVRSFEELCDTSIIGQFARNTLDWIGLTVSRREPLDTTRVVGGTGCIESVERFLLLCLLQRF